MDIINLVMTICLTASPGECREQSLHFEASGGLLNCLFLAPTHIARWSEEHPNLRVVKWRCAYPSRDINI